MEVNKMKIVIPTEDNNGLESKVSDHVGRSKTFTFLDENGNILKILPNTSDHMGGTESPPELMKRAGADILLCHGLGPRAWDFCKQFGIDMYISEKQTVGAVFAQWKNNDLKKIDLKDVCAHHRH
jgi:predicted Fe-Mo cluster-binding NifX family protein